MAARYDNYITAPHVYAKPTYPCRCFWSMEMHSLKHSSAYATQSASSIDARRRLHREFSTPPRGGVNPENFFDTLPTPPPPHWGC